MKKSLPSNVENPRGQFPLLGSEWPVWGCLKFVIKSGRLSYPNSPRHSLVTLGWTSERRLYSSRCPEDDLPIKEQTWLRRSSRICKWTSFINYVVTVITFIRPQTTNPPKSCSWSARIHCWIIRFWISQCWQNACCSIQTIHSQTLKTYPWRWADWLHFFLFCPSDWWVRVNHSR